MTYYIQFAFAETSNLKGMMMEHFLSVPGIIQSNMELYFFDDRPEFITGVQNAVDDFNRSRTEPVRLSTCLMPRSLSAAESPLQRRAYQQCLNDQSVIQLPIVSREESQAQTETAAQRFTSSFLLKILSHPATKVACAVLLLAGIVGVTVGSCGLAGVAVGISALLAKVFVGVGSGALVSAVGFFAANKGAEEFKKYTRIDYRVEI